MAPNAWTAEAVRDLLVAMAMSDSSSKPQPKWDRVETIMTDLGYNFTASAMSQYFTKRIWKDIVQKRHQLPGNPASTSASPASAAATPRSRKRPAPSSATSSTKKKQYSLQGAEMDTDDEWAEETPTKKLKLKTPVKKEMASKQGSSEIISVDGDDTDATLIKEEN